MEIHNFSVAVDVHVPASRADRGFDALNLRFYACSDQDKNMTILMK